MCKYIHIYIYVYMYVCIHYRYKYIHTTYVSAIGDMHMYLYIYALQDLDKYIYIYTKKVCGHISYMILAISSHIAFTCSCIYRQIYTHIFIYVYIYIYDQVWRDYSSESVQQTQFGRSCQNYECMCCLCCAHEEHNFKRLRLLDDVCRVKSGAAIYI